MAADHWMAGVKRGIKKRGTEGVFKRAAQDRGESTHQFAEEDKHKTGKMGARARLALAYESARSKR